MEKGEAMIIEQTSKAAKQKRKAKQPPPEPKKETALAPMSASERKQYEDTMLDFDEFAYEYLTNQRRIEELEGLLSYHKEIKAEMEEKYPRSLSVYRKARSEIGKVAVKRTEEIIFEKKIKADKKKNKEIKKEDKKKLQVLREKRKRSEKEIKDLDEEFRTARRKRNKVEEEDE